MPWSRKAEGAEAGNRVRMAVGTKAPSTSLSDHVQQGSFQQGSVPRAKIKINQVPGLDTALR